MAEMTAKQLRKAQIGWLDDIMQRTGLNLMQLADECNVIAQQNELKTINKDTLRQFYHYDTHKGEGARTLSERIIFLLYKSFGIEPPFDNEFQYDMKTDEAEISLHAKFCKQYITEVSLAKGIYRQDIGREVGLHTTTISRLFNDKLPKGLQMQSLELIRERFGVNYSPRFRNFLEKRETEDGIVVVAAYHLASDQVLMHAKADQWRVPIQIEGMPHLTQAIEAKGKQASPFLNDGAILFFNDLSTGVGAGCINQTCLVQREDGEYAIGFVTRSDKPGLFRVQSAVTLRIEEMRLKKAAKLLLTQL